MKTKKYPLENEGGMIYLEHLWVDVFALKLQILKSEGFSGIEKNVRLALKEAKDMGAHQILNRLDKNQLLASEVGELLEELGFRFKHERIEFKTPVSELPNGEGNPLLWKTAKDLGWEAKDIATFLKAAAVGDPDYDPNEDALTYVQDFLSDSVLTSGLDCVHIGFLEEEKVAMGVVQINPNTGWSRISYMGVLPSFRGKNVGYWLHRHCFEVMKKREGKLYHGGTTSTNESMLRLFEKNGCHRFATLEERVFLVTD